MSISSLIYIFAAPSWILSNFSKGLWCGANFVCCIHPVWKCFFFPRLLFSFYSLFSLRWTSLWLVCRTEKMKKKNSLAKGQKKHKIYAKKSAGFFISILSTFVSELFPWKVFTARKNFCDFIFSKVENFMSALSGVE